MKLSQIFQSDVEVYLGYLVILLFSFEANGMTEKKALIFWMYKLIVVFVAQNRFC